MVADGDAAYIGHDLTEYTDAPPEKILRVAFSDRATREVALPPFPAPLRSAGASALALDGGYVYWLVDVGTPHADGSQTMTRTFGRTAAAGGAPETLPPFGADSSYVRLAYRSSFTIFDGGLWFYDAAGEYGGAVVRYDLASRKPTSIATMSYELDWSRRSIHASRSRLLWTELGAIASVSSGSRSPSRTPLADQPLRVVGDEAGTYVLTSKGLVSAPSFENALKVDQVFELALDADYVYVLSAPQGDPRLEAVPRRGGERVVLYEAPGQGDAQAGLFRADRGLLFSTRAHVRRIQVPLPH